MGQLFLWFLQKKVRRDKIWPCGAVKCEDSENERDIGGEKKLKKNMRGLKRFYYDMKYNKFGNKTYDIIKK